MTQIKVSMPSGKWKNVTLAQFAELRRVPAIESNIDRMIRVVEVMEGDTRTPVMDIDVSKLHRSANKWLPLLDTTPSNKLRTTVKVNGRRYTFTVNIAKLKAHQYIDMKLYLSKVQGDEDALWDSMHKVIGCLTTDHPEYKDDDMRALPMTFVFPLSAFFLRAFESLTNQYLLYLTGQAEEALDMLNGLPINGDGMSPLTRSRIATQAATTKSLIGQLRDLLTR